MSDSEPPPPIPFIRTKDRQAPRFSGAQESAIREREEQAFRHREATEDQAFRHREAERDNRQRRVIVNVVSGFLLTTAIVSFGVAVVADADGTREWAQGLVTLLIGGLVGFLTGRAIT